MTAGAELSPDDMSLPDLLRLYSQEAMAYDHGDAEGHIKGFFFEERTAGMNLAVARPERTLANLLPAPRLRLGVHLAQGVSQPLLTPKPTRSTATRMPRGTAVRPSNSAVESCSPHRMRIRVILERWYAPSVKLFDSSLSSLPLPPSKFVCVMQKSALEHFAFPARTSPGKPARRPSCKLAYDENTANGERYDMVKRPGEDVVDVIPWHLNPAGDVAIFSKCDYPRPIANTQPRRMTSNLDGKIWSGHMIEAVGGGSGRRLAKRSRRSPAGARASFARRASARSNPALLLLHGAGGTEISAFNPCTSRSRGPAEHDAAVAMPTIPDSATMAPIRSHEALRLLPAIQVGMLAEARLELNLYNLLHRLRKPVGPWIGGTFQPGESAVENPGRRRRGSRRCQDLSGLPGGRRTDPGG